MAILTIEAIFFQIFYLYVRSSDPSLIFVLIFSAFVLTWELSFIIYGQNCNLFCLKKNSIFFYSLWIYFILTSLTTFESCFLWQNSLTCIVFFQQKKTNTKKNLIDVAFRKYPPSKNLNEIVTTNIFCNKRPNCFPWNLLFNNMALKNLSQNSIALYSSVCLLA